MDSTTTTHPDSPPNSPPARKGNPPPALLERLAEATAGPDGTILRLGTVACLALLGLTFYSTLRYMVYVWSTDENYSHGFLVPLISLYFANEAARRGPVAYRDGTRLGAGLLAVALLGKLATVLVPVGFVGDLSFLLAVAGIVALLAGRDALRRYGFAIGFLVFMVPLPVALYARIASPLQLLVSRVASVGLGAIGVPVLCEGNLMTLPGDVQMFVAEACSGMRQLTGFLALTTAVAYLTDRPAWHRGLLVLGSLPIALTANTARVVTTGLIMYHVDPSYASGAYHTIEGLLMMGLGLALLYAFSAGLDLVANLLAEGLGTDPDPAAGDGVVGRRASVGAPRLLTIPSQPAPQGQP